MDEILAATYAMILKVNGASWSDIWKALKDLAALVRFGTSPPYQPDTSHTCVPVTDVLFHLDGRVTFMYAAQPLTRANANGEVECILGFDFPTLQRAMACPVCALFVASWRLMACHSFHPEPDNLLAYLAAKHGPANRAAVEAMLAGDNAARAVLADPKQPIVVHEKHAAATGLKANVSYTLDQVIKFRFPQHLQGKAKVQAQTQAQPALAKRSRYD
jgi:hypothetical protein